MFGKLPAHKPGIVADDDPVFCDVVFENPSAGCLCNDGQIIKRVIFCNNGSPTVGTKGNITHRNGDDNVLRIFVKGTIHKL